LTTLAAKSPKNSYNTVTLMISPLIFLPLRRSFMKFNLLQTLQANFDSVNTVPPAKKPKSTPIINNDADLRPNFWQEFSLFELTNSEWEALCDGCGCCCLIKYMDDDDETVEYTDVACKLMDCSTGHCQNYERRQDYVPDCIQLTQENISEMTWLPSHCAYKRVFEGKSLPNWHLLITKDAAKTEKLMRAANIGVAGRCVSETGMSDEEMELRVVTWVDA